MSSSQITLVNSASNSSNNTETCNYIFPSKHDVYPVPCCRSLAVKDGRCLAHIGAKKRKQPKLMESFTRIHISNNELNHSNTRDWNALNSSNISMNDVFQTYTPGKLDFPSDHFPVIARLDDEKGIGIMSFNVLNEKYKPYIHGGQELKDSQLDKMTESQRCDIIVSIIDRAFSNGVGIVALQEVSNNLLMKLYKTTNLVVILTPNMSSKGADNGTILFNPKQVKISGNIITVPYTAEDKYENYIQQVKFSLVSDPNKEFTFVNTHVKFGLIKQLISVLKKIKGPIIATGDFNVGFKDPREESSPEPLLKEKEFNLLLTHASYSHVNTLQQLDLFDHFYTRNVTLVGDPELLNIVRSDLKL